MLWITLLTDLGDGWYRYGNSAFKLFQKRKNWEEARNDCQSFGGDLASITSSHENEFLKDVLVKNADLSNTRNGEYKIHCFC